MTKAVRIHKPGSANELVYESIEVGVPTEGEVRLKQTAIGLNYIDVYHRTGLYPLAEYPAVIGMEAAGVVEDIGSGVDGFSIGDRVAYAGLPVGAYALARNIPAHRLIKIPDSIDDEQAAAMMLQGMTASYLLNRSYPVQKGDTILIHAAAGGVGLIACQWAKALGATVIGTVGSDAKAELAKANGCDHPILYTSENFTDRVRDITNGEGVPVVYDSIGKDTFEGSLDCLKPLGVMVSYGNASGPVTAFDPGILAAKGSLYLTRPTLMTHTAKREDLVNIAGGLIDMVASGKVKINIGQRYPLSQAKQAHIDLEARKTTGSTVFIPD